MGTITGRFSGALKSMSLKAEAVVTKGPGKKKGWFRRLVDSVVEFIKKVF